MATFAFGGGSVLFGRSTQTGYFYSRLPKAQLEDFSQTHKGYYITVQSEFSRYYFGVRGLEKMFSLLQQTAAMGSTKSGL